ncbi:MAG: beta-galactosidase [Verrucomicrobiota bacterium]
MTLRSLCSAVIGAGLLLVGSVAQGQVRYSFETGTDGWVTNDAPTVKAVTNVARASTYRQVGSYSLRVGLKLQGSVSNWTSGETYVDMQNYPPYGVPVPADLLGKTIKMYVFCPPASYGDPSHPNGLQIFVKDDQFRNEYSTWSNIVVGTTGAWNCLTFAPYTNSPYDPGFNPRKVRIVGLKVGAGSGSTYVYAGPVYLDGVDFASSAANFVAPTNEKYGFTTSPMGWEVSTDMTARAATNLLRITNPPSNATAALRINLKLVATNVPQRAGEAFVMMVNNPPFGAEPPVNLSGRVVRARVFCPSGLRGIATNANGLQLFVKDSNYKSFYGSWTHIQQGYWMEVSATPSTVAPTNGFMEPGFDPTKVALVGVKIAAPPNSTATYTGYVYVDGVGFDPIVPARSAPNLSYDFEKDTDGFVISDYTNSLAVTSVVRSTTRAAIGSGSLQMNVKLVATNAARNNGEASVDMQWWPPNNVVVVPYVVQPVNLDGKQASVYVWSPAGARGTNAAPNGFQLFVKDDSFRAEMGTWTPVCEGVWQKVKLTPSTVAPTNGSMQPGFDPTRIRTIGIKYAAGTNKISANYTGPIYVDAFDFLNQWESLANLRYGFEPNKEGWAAESSNGMIAVTSVAWATNVPVIEGTHALKLNVSVNNPTTNKVYGAASVDMRYYPPAIVRAPFDLQARKVFAYVYCPQGTQGGNPRSPNQLRLFVKDSNFKVEYGAPVAMQNLEWVKVQLTPAITTPPGGYMDAGFDPTSIAAIGVEIGMVGSYTGAMYVDYVSFPADPPAMPATQHAYGFEPPSQADWWTWDTDAQAWNAHAWTNVYYATNAGYGGSIALAANAVFANTNAPFEDRKGVFVIEYNPPLNLSTKTHRTCQAKLKFEPPVEGLLSFDASINVYDKITDQWYAKSFKIGGSDWNILEFDLDDPADYDQGSPVPMNAAAIGAVSIQIFGNIPWSGRILLDDVVIGGVERGTDYNLINSGFMTRSATKFQLDGQDFYFAGANIEYMFSVSDSVCEELLDVATNMHLQAVRTWAFHEGKEYSFQPERGVWNELAFEHLDRIVAMTGHRGLRLLLGLCDNWGHNGGMFQYMHWVSEEHPESMDMSQPPGSILYHDQFYTNAWARQWYRDFVTKLLTRTNTITGRAYRNDPTIIAWEIVNEPRCESDYTGRTIHNWLWTMSDYVRSVDTNHVLGGGEEGGYVKTYNQANQVPWETFPDNYYHYALHGVGEDYCTEWGCGRGHGVDFVSDHSTEPSYVQWQGGTWTNPGTVYGEVRPGVSNINFSTFRIYVDQKEYNIWRTNSSGYDQRVEWINDHEYDAHYLIGKPTILEEYGIHAIGWIYNGSFGQIQLKRTPQYTLQDRANIFQMYYDLVDELDINGTFFWNLGYQGMWEDPFYLCESVGAWYWDGSTAASGISLSTNYVIQGAGSLKLSYNVVNPDNNKAIYSLNTNEQWVVRERGGAPTGVNRVKFFWSIYNPGGSIQVALALKGTPSWTWAEALEQTLTTGWNRVMFDLSADSWACAAGGWQHNWHLLDVKDASGTNVLEDVRQVSLVFYGLPTGQGSLYVDNVTIKRDDGFVIYADDPAVPVIRAHADRMATKAVMGNVQYSFETDTEGWFFDNGGAGASNTTSSAQAFHGQRSLEIGMNRAAWQTVEACADVDNYPIDLKNSPIQIRVFCPTGARGSPTDPNHIYLKVKDTSWRSYMIASADVTENQWVTFTITPSTNTPPGGYMDGSFDPEVIRRIYVVFSCQSAGYIGPIYVDAVSYTPNQRPNNPPSVNAGTDRAVTWPARASLDGTVTDDGEPKGHSVTATWSYVSGPGAVTFTNAGTVDTAAEFATPGVYVLRLSASDSQYMSYDEVTVTVNPNGSAERVQYNFETGTEGWGPGTRTTAAWYNGAASLQVDVSGSGASTAVYPAQTNLQGQAIRIRVYCPAGARGSVSNPNRLNVFVKDGAWANEWTYAWPVVENQWTTYTIWPSTTTPLGGYKDSTFTPTTIRMIGVQFQNYSTPYAGPIYVDYVTFSQ